MRHNKNLTRVDRWLNVASVASVVLTLVAISLSYFTFDRFSQLLANADLIQTPAVFADIFERGGSFADWNIAPAPAIVPEYGFYALAYVVGVTSAGRILAYALIQILVFWAALYGLSRVAVVRRPLVVASLSVSVMGLFAIMRVLNFMQLTMSAIHFGGFILQIVAVALVVLLWRRRETLSARASIGLIVGISAVSLVASFNDALFVVQFAAPVCLIVVGGIALRRISWRPGLLLATSVALASIVGWRLYPIVMPNPSGSSGEVDLGSLNKDVASFVDVWGYELSRSPIAPLLILASVALGVFGAYRLVARQRARLTRWMPGSTLPTLAVFALLSGTLPLVAAFVSAAGTTPRYALPLFYWPCILVPMILVQIDWRETVAVAVVISCAVSLVSMSYAVRDVARHGISESFYPESIACLDEAAEEFGVHHAIGTYWLAKPTQEFSRTGLTVTVLQKDLSVRHWIASSANAYPAYDAFIDDANNPNDKMRRSLNARFGKPVESISCPGSTMYVWKPGSISPPSS